MLADGLLVAGQILAAAVLGAAVGLEREFGAQPAGLRTHMLVSVGAAVFSIAGAGLTGSDPARLAAQVVTGVGFLAGGVIFREGVTVRGLTTAASLWVTAAAGVAIGLGAWWTAAVATALAIAVLWLVKQLEWRFLPLRRTIVMRVSLRPGEPVNDAARAVEEVLPRLKVIQIGYEDRHQVIELTARPPAGVTLPQLAGSILRVQGVAGVDISS
ncbi:MgtC/SapB family protein [Dactylosporangium matsuzakiense]|uniref:MgtC/SapB/SrpB/YhiD N-terminal domain-containing protein n=1 Tax=Dactylosporangium matsuzakiense TaxID=53360 RepID=A0A9W6KU81_9ACTN|nr:MgtC/SapB family protein [Dactylosporangium matsuzakiense]UWZ41398.1 MgtC/SapB family protein [Dactylosporangium matsuzakiense]GLL06500.1 hypothetical protein GCM10017581_082500 [Dactylosporangium matsuzakiense]